MGKGATLADVWSVYIKPSLDGRLVIRKKGVTRRSVRVLERNRIFATSGASVGCARQGPNGSPTPIKQFSRCLRGRLGGRQLPGIGVAQPIA